jgi:hypothetical protein
MEVYFMSVKAGLWIDHRQAFVVHLNNDEAVSEKILSNVEEHINEPRGSRSRSPFGPQDAFAEDRVDRKYKHHLDQYYEKVAQSIHDAKHIFIMGPGEAKGEFKKHLENSKHGSRHQIKIETTDKMPDVQIIKKVKEHYVN